MSEQARAAMRERFGRDALIALATLTEGEPRVRTVDAYYEDGAFYVITHAASGKMRQIAAHPRVAVCGDWFTGEGVAESLGPAALPENGPILGKLRQVFASWLDNGHSDVSDPQTCILRIRLTSAALMVHGVCWGLEDVLAE